LWMQNFISVIIVSVLSLLGLVSTEPLTWRLIKVWLPVNVIFVGMLITSMFRYEDFNFVAFIMLPFIFHYNIFDNLPKGITGTNIL
jgi:GDP-mannose transporter